jgi:uncharacterized protein (DUF302 family)
MTFERYTLRIEQDTPWGILVRHHHRPGRHDMAAQYGIGCVLDTPYEDTVANVRAALKDEGFGVITEIDVRATMKEKLGIEGDDYVILGACNPALAHKVLTAEPELGLLLPCNVVVRATAEGTRVSAIDPMMMVQMEDNPVLDEVAAEVRTRLDRVLESLNRA